MNQRTITVFGMAAALVLGACGSGAPKTMSENDFVDTLTSLCEDARDAADEAEPPELFELFDVVAEFTDDGLDVLADLQKGLRDIVPPREAADDFAAFVQIVEDEIGGVEAMRQGGEDEDADAVSDANDDLVDLLADQADVADDLGVDACAGIDLTIPPAPLDAPVSPDPSVPTDATLPTESSLPTDATLPVTTLPVVTLPVVTLPTVPETAPPSPAPAGGSIELATLADVYAPPAGYTLVDRTVDQAQGFIDVVASYPLLSDSVAQLGVADLLDASGAQAATIVIAVTYENVDLMPSDWTVVLCDPATSTQVTSPGGQSGTSCPGTTESGIIEAFTLELGAYGFSLVTFDPALSAVTLFDDFATANV